MDVLLYIRGGGGVAEVNEWRVRARTQGAGGALASSEVSLPAGTSSRVSQRERVPYTPKRGSGSHSCGLSPQPRPVPPASLLEPKVPGEPVFTPPHSHSQGSGPAGARSRRLALTWLSSQPGFSVLGPWPRRQTYLPEAQPLPRVTPSCPIRAHRLPH